MAHRRDRERWSEEQRREPREQPPEQSAAERVLALQRSAGNQAVTGLLARDTKPKEKEKTAAPGAQATLSGIGTIALRSVSFPPQAGRPGDPKDGPRELVFTSDVGEHSAKLMRASLDGKAMTVEIVMPGGMTLKLEGAIVGSYSTSSGGGGRDELESWTLNFASIEQQPGAAEAEPGE